MTTAWRVRRAQREPLAWQHWFYTCPQMPSLVAATIANDKSIDAYLMRDIISIPHLVHALSGRAWECLCVHVCSPVCMCVRLCACVPGVGVLEGGAISPQLTNQK